MSTLNVNAIDKESGSTLTLGGSGTQVTLHASATSSGFDSGLASVQTFTSSGTWTKPSGITKVVMYVTGGGGAGAPRGSGGGAGGTAIKFLDVSSISSSTITIGAAGSGGVYSTSTHSTSGGATSWADGTNTVTGNGGSAQAGNSTAQGQAGGTATSGDINLTGGDGHGCRNDTYNQYLGGHGGASYWGGGGAMGVNGAHNDGEPGEVYGAGGGGGSISGGENGGDGMAGIVIVWEYK